MLSTVSMLEKRLGRRGRGQAGVHVWRARPHWGRPPSLCSSGLGGGTDFQPAGQWMGGGSRGQSAVGCAPGVFAACGTVIWLGAEMPARPPMPVESTVNVRAGRDTGRDGRRWQRRRLRGRLATMPTPTRTDMGRMGVLMLLLLLLLGRTQATHRRS